MNSKEELPIHTFILTFFITNVIDCLDGLYNFKYRMYKHFHTFTVSFFINDVIRLFGSIILRLDDKNIVGGCLSEALTRTSRTLGAMD